MQEAEQTSCWKVETLTAIESERQTLKRALTGSSEKTLSNITARIYNFLLTVREREAFHLVVAM